MDDDVYDDEIGPLHGPEKCPSPCSECSDGNHHLIESWVDALDIEEVETRPP